MVLRRLILLKNVITFYFLNGLLKENYLIKEDLLELLFVQFYIFPLLAFGLGLVLEIERCLQVELNFCVLQARLLLGHFDSNKFNI